MKFDSGKLKKCFIVAEVSANHGQDIGRAIKMIKEAKKCGADAVKFQAYTPDSLTIDVRNRYFEVKHPEWGGQTLYDLYKKAYTPLKWFKKLKDVADKENILFFATAFDKEGVDLLEGLRVPVHKIASFELVDIPLIEYAAKTGKPLIFSTGMADFSEIKEAVGVARRKGAKDISLLKCVSSYPAEPGQMNLNTILDMKRSFKCTVGLSDHSLGNGVAIAGCVLGAKIIEKHFVLSKKIKTPDSFFSIDPSGLKELVGNIREVEKALGTVKYGPDKEEKKSLRFRRSLFAVRDIKKGEVFTEENIRSIRPNYGAKPKYLKKIVGKTSKKNIKRGTPVKVDFYE